MTERGDHCDHRCCGIPTQPFHDHFLTPDECPRCQHLRAVEGGTDEQ